MPPIRPRPIGEADRRKLETIIKEICEEHKITREQFLSPCRDEHLVLPRWLVSHCATKFTSLRQIAIARAVQRDHGTISYGIAALKDRCATDKSIASGVVEWEAYFETILSTDGIKQEGAEGAEKNSPRSLCAPVQNPK